MHVTLSLLYYMISVNHTGQIYVLPITPSNNELSLVNNELIFMVAYTLMLDIKMNILPILEKFTTFCSHRFIEKIIA